MIPLAGDELTELIVQHYLVDFQTAERIKLASTTGEMITYKDIMMIEHSIPAKEVWELIEPVTDKMTTAVAEKIKELNGGQTVSATFVVGGGGKIHGYTEMLADKLGLPQERVALRGEEVLQEVTFEQPDIYQDVCYPVTKDFREKLYNEIISEYEKAKDKSNEKARESAEKHHGNPDKEKDSVDYYFSWVIR